MNVHNDRNIDIEYSEGFTVLAPSGTPCAHLYTFLFKSTGIPQSPEWNDFCQAQFETSGFALLGCEFHIICIHSQTDVWVASMLGVYYLITNLFSPRDLQGYGVKDGLGCLNQHALYGPLQPHSSVCRVSRIHKWWHILLSWAGNPY